MSTPDTQPPLSKDEYLEAFRTVLVILQEGRWDPYSKTYQKLVKARGADVDVPTAGLLLTESLLDFLAEEAGITRLQLIQNMREELTTVEALSSTHSDQLKTMSQQFYERFEDEDEGMRVLTVVYRAVFDIVQGKRFVLTAKNAAELPFDEENIFYIAALAGSKTQIALDLQFAGLQGPEAVDWFMKKQIARNPYYLMDAALGNMNVSAQILYQLSLINKTSMEKILRRFVKALEENPLKS